jgi:hypothetical protein
MLVYQEKPCSFGVRVRRIPDQPAAIFVAVNCARHVRCAGTGILCLSPTRVI